MPFSSCKPWFYPILHLLTCAGLWYAGVILMQGVESLWCTAELLQPYKEQANQSAALLLPPLSPGAGLKLCIAVPQHNA